MSTRLELTPTRRSASGESECQVANRSAGFGRRARPVDVTESTIPIPVAAALIGLMASSSFVAAPAAGHVAWAQGTGGPQVAREPRPVQVMILGTYHFANPGQDAINTEADDVMKPERQAEIRAVVDSLARFEPTKVAVEWPRDEAVRFDSIYQEYLAGRHELTRNERQQLGMRLARRMGHDHMYAIDAEGEFPLLEVIEYAREHERWFIDYFEDLRERRTALSDSMQSHHSIGEILRWTNESAEIQATLAPYMRTAEVGADSNFIGVKPVAAYYERNLHIFANLTEIAEPGDRVVVIFGSGHSPFLRHFVEGHSKMQLVEPNDFIGG